MNSFCLHLFSLSFHLKLVFLFSTAKTPGTVSHFENVYAVKDEIMPKAHQKKDIHIAIKISVISLGMVFLLGTSITSILVYHKCIKEKVKASDQDLEAGVKRSRYESRIKLKENWFMQYQGNIAIFEFLPAIKRVKMQIVYSIRKHLYVHSSEFNCGLTGSNEFLFCNIPICLFPCLLSFLYLLKLQAHSIFIHTV